MRFSIAALLALFTAALLCPAQETKVDLTVPRQAVEKADYRFTGHLVRVDPGGTRTSFPIVVKAHWFPGVLRVLVNVSAPGSSTAQRAQAVHVLLELHPNGQNSIRVAHPGDTAANPLPVDKWTDGVAGTGFSFEDFLEEQYFWSGQVITPHIKFGARDCDLLKSTPGPTDRTNYSEVRTWLDSIIYFPVYVEKNVKKSSVVKEYTYYGLRHEGGVWSANQIEEKNHGQTGTTLLIIDRGTPKANLGLADFSPEQLTRFP